MSAPRPDESFRQAAEAHVMKALDAIGEILGDKTAPAATRLRAAFGLIELVYGRPRSHPNGVAEVAERLAQTPTTPRKESIDERFARLRREKAAQTIPAPAG